MSQENKRSTLQSTDLESVAAAAVQRALDARGQAGIELTGEQLNNISGGASYYLKDPFIYGIKVDPIWFRGVINPAVNPQVPVVIGTNTLVR